MLKNIFSKKEINIEQHLPCHLISRAVDGKEVFAKEDDCFRFIFQMHAANIGSPGSNLYRRDIKKIGQAILNGEKIPPKCITIEHPPLVDFLSLSLVINHHHFILASNTKNGIPKYLQKLHGGFAKYYNLKYGRKDTLFERQYGIIPIQNEFQLDAVIRYVNIKNPLDVYQSNWRERGLKNEKEALDFLDNYQFSSFPDLYGKRNCKILVSKSMLEKYLGKGLLGDRTIVPNYIKDFIQRKLTSYNSVFLEENNMFELED